MARMKGGARLMQMSKRKSTPKAMAAKSSQPTFRTMVPGGQGSRLMQGMGPAGLAPMAGAGQSGGGSSRGGGGILKNFTKSLQGMFNRGVQKAGRVMGDASRLGRQAGQIQRIEGELQGIAGRIDQMTRAKEQFDSGVDELSDAIVKNHIESVGLDAMMQEMRANQEAQKEMSRYKEMARNEPVPTGPDFDTLNAIRSADQKYERFEYGEDALARFDELMNSGKSLPDYIEVNTGDGYRVIDVAREIPEFAPFTNSSRTEVQRRDIQRGIKALGMP
jgi:hypothetical protein